MKIKYNIIVEVEDSSQPIPKDFSIAERFVDLFPVSRGSLGMFLISLTEIKGRTATKVLRCESLVGGERELKELNYTPKLGKKRTRIPSTNLHTLYKGGTTRR